MLLGRVGDLRRKRAEVSKLERFTKRNKGPKGYRQAILLGFVGHMNRAHKLCSSNKVVLVVGSPVRPR